MLQYSVRGLKVTSYVHGPVFSQQLLGEQLERSNIFSFSSSSWEFDGVVNPNTAKQNYIVSIYYIVTNFEVII